MYHIFISYRREGGDMLAGRLSDRFKALGYSVFFDTESMRSGRFNEQLYTAVEQSENVLLVLSVGALDEREGEDWMRNEIAHAFLHGKNIIPVMVSGFEFPKELPSEIDDIRYIEGVTVVNEYFDAAVKRIESFLADYSEKKAFKKDKEREFVKKTRFDYEADLKRKNAEYEKCSKTDKKAVTLLYEIASLYRNLKDYENALATYEKLYAIWGDVLGGNDFYTQNVLENLAELYNKKGDGDNALKYYELYYKALCDNKEDKSYSAAKTLFNLGGLYAKQGQNEKSLEAYENLYRLKGENRLLLDGEFYMGFANAYANCGNFKNALPLYKKAVSVSHLKREKLGAKCAVAETHKNLGEFKKSAESYEKIFKTERAFDKYNASAVVINAVKNYIAVCEKLGDVKRAHRFIEEYFGLSGRKKPTLQTVKDNENIAWLYAICSDAESALYWYTECYENSRSLLGSDHKNTLDALSRVVVGTCNQGAYSRALPKAKELYELRVKVDGELAEKTLEALYVFALCEAKNGNTELALVMYERLYTQQLEVYGLGNPHAQKTKEIIEALKGK